MAGNIFVSLRTPTTMDVLSRRRDGLTNQVMNALKASESGAVGGAIDPDDIEVVASTGDTAAASAALAASGAATTVGATINGVSVTATAAGGDTATCALIAAAINASSNALVLGFVRASNLVQSITLASVPAGVVLNLCGFKFTSTAAATGKVGEFSIAGTDAQDCTALCAAINAHPAASRWLYAVADTAVVRLFARQFSFTSPNFSWPTLYGTPPNALLVETPQSGSGITLGGSSIAAGAYVGVVANYRGVIGNAITFAATGTGMTSVAANTRLVSGLGGAAVALVGGVRY